MIKSVELFRNSKGIYYAVRREEEIYMFIPPEIKKCIGFIGYETKKNGTKFCGTGFFITAPYEKPHRRTYYFITAKHNIEKISSKKNVDEILIRFNAVNGGYLNLKTSLKDWVFHNSTDIAILKNEALDIRGMDKEFIPQEHFINKEFIRENYIGIGERVVIVGLFAKHGGEERNLPILRLGHIAMMPDDPIETENLSEIEAYIIEAISIGGLSGSPVFTIKNEVPKGNFKVERQLYLLGLLHGHWELPKEIIGQIDDGSRDKINTGLAIVIPADKILEVLEYEDLKKEREETRRQQIKENSPIED